MKRLCTVLLLCHAVGVISVAQVKSIYLYNTSTPYGVLDLRTSITSTNYYYLQENKTFSFRESSPGVRTNTFLDMTSWDSSPYKQGNLRHKNGTKDDFVMNYRLLFPLNYVTSYAEGYPLIVMMHGAVERGNCYYNNCYHATPAYDPNVNSPAAPKTSTHKLLNNDHSISIGGLQHLNARNLAGTKLPNDPTMPAKAFPGFVLFAQMFNVWDSLNVQDVIKLVRLICAKYKIDQNRIYIHGLSIGGYATYEALKRAPWLFTAALPMSAVHEAANIFKQNQQAKVIHIPLWIFQGGVDKNPSPSFTNSIVTKFRNAGAIVRYTVYPTLGHSVWNKAYAEADFFSWITSKNKANIHPFKGITNIVRSSNQFPKLILAEGFFAYQWEKNGVIISTAKSNTYTATTPGTYRARFSRISSAPTASQWNRWSAPVTVTETSQALAAREYTPEEDSAMMEEDTESRIFSATLYPNPAPAGDLNLQLNARAEDGPVQVTLVDPLGRELYQAIYDAADLPSDQKLMISSTLPDGIYLVLIHQGTRQLKERVMIKN